MDRGQLQKDGNTSDVITAYLAKAHELASGDLSARTDRAGKGLARVTGVDLLDSHCNPLVEAVSGSDCVLRVSYSVKPGETLKRGILVLDLSSELKSFVGLSTELASKRELQFSGDGHIDFLVPNLPLLGGRYSLSAYLEAEGEAQDVIDDAAVVNIVDGDFFGTGKSHHKGWHGEYVLVPHSWEQNS